MGHIALLGDSIFDNGRYVPGGPAVVEQLQSRLPAGWQASLLARDGAGTGDIERQLAVLPEDATHIALSVGGNDALDVSPLLMQDQIELDQIANALADFQSAYRRTLHSVLRRGRKTVVCTIYDSIPDLRPRERTALCLFNDVILREAFRVRASVIDLRLICTDRDDYSKASPIEPSSAGGAKIARAICRACTTEDGATEASQVFT